MIVFIGYITPDKKLVKKQFQIALNMLISNRNEIRLNSITVDVTATADDFVSFDNNVDTSENVAYDIILNDIMKNNFFEQADCEDNEEIDSSVIEKISKIKNIDEIISNVE